MSEILYLTIVIFSILFLVKNLKAEYLMVSSFAIVSISLYSGLGILLYDLPFSYIVNFAIYVLAFEFAFVFIIKTKRHNGMETEIQKTKREYLEKKLIRSSYIFGIAYMLTYFIYLIYPTVRLYQIFYPPKMNVYGIVGSSELVVSSGPGRLGNYIQVLCKPFFYIILYDVWMKRKKFFAIFLLLLDFYLNTLKYSYFGRTDFVTTLFLIVIIISLNGYKQKRFKRDISRWWKLIRNMGIAGLFAIPFLVSYLSLRTGQNVELLSIFTSMKSFIKSEFYYPIYFEKIVNTPIVLHPIDYFVWLISLPIPKFMIPELDITQINVLFTEAVRGISRTSEGFSYSLPSILGESFIVFGRVFSFVHAIILAIISALACKFYKKYRCLTFYIYFIAIRTLAMGRGGSQGYISTIINTSILLVIITIFNRHIIFSMKS